MTEFHEFLQRCGAVMSPTDHGPVVDHFGSVADELQALNAAAVVCPVNSFCRIQVTGQDRAKFIHNFCTNNITGLQQGQCVEAFFTDVRARVLAHGYVCAFSNCIEIRMLAGDEQKLLNHLNRYIITEDVAISSVSRSTVTVAVSGPKAAEVLAQALPELTKELSHNQCQVTASGDVAVNATTWNGQPVLFVSCSDPVSVWNQLTSHGASPSGQIVFDHLRIGEGFPVVGRDITDDHLAPEADRITRAISYNKGCYLGQEPIARLDALGHVNRKLYRCHAESVETETEASSMATVTSVSHVEECPISVLAMLPVKDVQSGNTLLAHTTDGSQYQLKPVETA